MSRIRLLTLAFLALATSSRAETSWAPGAGTHSGSDIVDIPEPARAHYPDGRPAPHWRIDGVKDAGVVLAHGQCPRDCDEYGARDAWVFSDRGTFYMTYDAIGPFGWLVALATSQDLQDWTRRGTILSLGADGALDSKSASYGTIHPSADGWRMFYLGTPNATPAPDRVPQFPYLTLTATSPSPAGPWAKRPGEPLLPIKAASYYNVTASPGDIVAQPDGRYSQLFSAASLHNGKVLRTIGVARSPSLDGAWQPDGSPALPETEQVENTSLYFQASTKTWFMFTNHVGMQPDGAEFTDAIWVYWSDTPDKWDASRKALVLDGSSSHWSHKVIGLPSVIVANDELDVFFDGRQGQDSTSELRNHMDRDIGRATIALPIRLPPG